MPPDTTPPAPAAPRYPLAIVGARLDDAFDERRDHLDEDSPAWLCVIDIDHFKMINDRHGHKVGDLVLKMLAEVCQSALRDIDILARIGGEEFAVLLPETGGSVAVEVARRLQDSINEANLMLEGQLAIKIQVSIGVASMTSPHDNMDILLHRADTALYEAKNTGRNRICVAPN